MIELMIGFPLQEVINKTDPEYSTQQGQAYVF